MRKKRECCVVDTNVAVTADHRATAGPDCIRACVSALQDIMAGNKKLVLDEAGEIVSEYRDNLYSQNQPNIGMVFLRWIWTNQYNANHCSRVRINIKLHSGGDYEEFPPHGGLRDFDFADRKFVAVAIAHEDKPMILEATDTKWWGWKDALLECGVRVKFLCEKEIAANFLRKFEHD